MNGPGSFLRREWEQGEGAGAGQAAPSLAPMLALLQPDTWVPDSPPFLFSPDLGFPKSPGALGRLGVGGKCPGLSPERGGLPWGAGTRLSSNLPIPTQASYLTTLGIFPRL